MPKRISKFPLDENQAAFAMVQRSTADPVERPAEKRPSKAEIARIMRVMGRRGGKIGGKRRLETMTEEERRAVALKAARARWDKKK
jgi:hypothetical protein